MARTPKTPDKTEATPDAAVDVRPEANSLIKTHVAISMTAGLVPLPLLDIVALTGNQVKMIHGLAELYDVEFNEGSVRASLYSLLGGSLPVLGVSALSSGAKLIPGIGTLFGSGAVSVTGGATTYAVGRVFARHFENGGDLSDFSASAVRGAYRSELKQGKKNANGEAADDKAA